MKNKKLLIGIIIAVSFAVLGLAILFVISKNNNSEFQPTNNWHLVSDLPLSAKLYPVKKDEKWGYIDDSGKMVIDAKYDYAYYFYGDIAEVEIADVKYLIDKTGNVIASGSSDFYDDYYGTYIVNGNMYYQNTKKLNSDDVYVYPFDYDKYYGGFLHDTGLFGFYNKNQNITGVINRKGEIIYQTTSKERIELLHDETASENFHNFPSRYCVIEVDDKSGVINCDTGLEIYPLTEKYDYYLIESNLIEINKDFEYIRAEYIYQDKIKNTFNQVIEFAENQSNHNYIVLSDEDENDIYMLLDGTIVNEDDELLKYDEYNKANYLLNNKFELFTKYNEINEENHLQMFNTYGIKVNNKVVIPAEFDDFYFDLNNDKYVIGRKEIEEIDTFYLYNLDTPSTVILQSDSMGFINDKYIYYYRGNDKVIYNLETEDELITEKNAYIYGYYNFIEIGLNKNRKIYNSKFNMIFEYE